LNAVVSDLEGSARRFETPCGTGALVWRAWGRGPPVVLAHGSHGAWSHWIHNINALAQQRTVWVPDLPGYGDSAVVPTEDHATISAVIAVGLRQLLGSEGPPDVVGFSLGGVLAAHLAVRHPELVRRLIIVGSGGLGTPVGSITLRRVRGLEGDERRAVNRENLLALMLHDPASVDDLALYVQAINGARARLDPVSLVLPDKLLAALPQLSMQVDAIWGEYDRPHPNPAVQEAALRRFHPKLDFRIIPGAGHWAMYEKPMEFNRTVLDLLGSKLRPND
jgi:2-hydroxy-6-oxonona-2,4-dienedioate hydrolase